MKSGEDKIGKTRQEQQKVRIAEIFDSGAVKARGILRPIPSGGQFTHVRPPAPPDLASWIDHYWMVSWTLSQPFLQETLPHPNTYLVFENAKCVIAGVSTHKFSRVLEGDSGVFGVKFKPGGFRPFLKAPVAALLNRIVPARHIFGEDADILEKALDSLSWETEKMVDSANRFFRERPPQPDANVELADRIVGLILQDRHIKTVDDLVERTQMGKRRLQRLFNEYVGITPKWVIRRYRLHDLIDVLNCGEEPDWAQTALELGYFDQAHLINDFRSIVGYAPTKYPSQG